MEPPEILAMNIYDSVFKHRFLLIGICVPKIYPDIFNNFKTKYRNVCSACLENTHYNKVFAKLIDILAVGNTKELGFLTVDGSPHCIQMHFMSTYLKRALKPDIKYSHFVITKNKEVFKLRMNIIDESKSLSNRGKKFKLNNY